MKLKPGLAPKRLSPDDDLEFLNYDGPDEEQPGSMQMIEYDMSEDELDDYSREPSLDNVPVLN